MDALFDGKKLEAKDGTLVDPATLATTEVVGLYFSAHWCPPCKAFTPKAAAAYETIKAAKKSLEIIFVSSDKDEASFKSYRDEMPWMALPFAERDLKAKLSKKFKVSGIPSLILLDGATGKIISKDGRSALMKDPKGDKFPWTPPTFAAALGSKLVKADGTEVVTDQAIKGKHYGIYFSAHWCGPCKGFTPKLVEVYNKLAISRPGEFEVIFVSADRNQGMFDDYFKTMPWLAVPYDDRDRESELSELFEVEGIPTLVIVGPDGKVVNTEGVQAVASDAECDKYPWKPQPVISLQEAAGSLNEIPAVVVFGSNEKLADEVLRPVAQETMNKKESGEAGDDFDLIFCTSTDPKDGVATQIRKLCDLGAAAAEKMQMVLLDVADGGGYYSYDGEVTEASVRSFVADYRVQKLERKQMKQG